jgi:hypothetical protein
MTTSRSIKRAGERKKSKEAKKALAGIGDELSKMPKVCGECGVAFDKNDKTSLTWRIAIYDDGPVHLACPDCIPDSVKNQQ